MGIYEGQNAKNYVASLRRAKQIFPEQRPKPCRPLSHLERAQRQNPQLQLADADLPCLAAFLVSPQPHLMRLWDSARSDAATKPVETEYDCSFSPCRLRFTLSESSKHHGTPELGRSSERSSCPLSKDVILAARKVLADGGVPNQHQHHSPTTAYAPLRCLAVYIPHRTCTPCSTSQFAYIVPLHIHAGHCEGSSFDSFECCCRYCALEG